MVMVVAQASDAFAASIRTHAQATDFLRDLLRRREAELVEQNGRDKFSIGIFS
jgi:hypothetical protein